MKILDLSAGKRAQWYSKKHPLTTYVDIRPEVEPDVVCDTRSLPFEDATFDLISFDPPHMCETLDGGHQLPLHTGAWISVGDAYTAGLDAKARRAGGA